MSTTFTANPAPPPDRFRNGDIWRGPSGRLYSVGMQLGMAPPLCILRPCGSGLPVYLRSISTRGWTRTSWGGQP